MTYFLKLNANGQQYYPNSSHILVENNSQIVQNSAVSFTLFATLFGTGGGDELVNRCYRDRAADDLGHRDVTRNLSREL